MTPYNFKGHRRCKVFRAPKCWKRLEHGAGLSGSLPTSPMPTMLTNADDVFELSSIPLATILNICDVGRVDKGC